MNAAEIIKKLREYNIELFVDDGNLRVRGTKLTLSDSDLLEFIRQNKKELIETIASGAYLGSANGLITVPPNLIPENSTVITPEMLPLADLSQEQIEEIVRAVPGGVVNVQDIYSLAPLQKGILFHHMLGGEGDPYLLSMLFGFVSRACLNDYLEALQAVINRHDILRTAVMWEGMAEPVQVVWRKADLPVEEVVLDGAMGDVAGQLYARFDPRAYRIDLRQAPLMRAYIAQDKEKERWLMMLLLHHLAGDHVTMEAAQREIELHLLGQADRLPVPVSFRNLVAQARLGMSEEEHETFFRSMLGDVEEPTAPFGLLDAQSDGRGIEEASVWLDNVLDKRLRERARKLGMSVASLCHLAWAQVLARVSDRQDVVFGTVLFGRMQGGTEAERVIGLFINTLPVRIRVAEEGVEASVRYMHMLLAELIGHEHASLALAQRCSKVPAPTPLFSGLLNYRHSRRATQNRSEEVLRAWVGIERLRGEERTNYPLVMSIDDLGEKLRLSAQVQGGIGAERVCEYMHRALESVVEALESEPGRRVGTLEVMPEWERQRVLYEWNETTREYRRDKCVHELFEEEAARMPGAVAVEYEGQALSYGELNRRGNQLGHYLRALGVGAEQRVGLCVERGVEMVVGLLGILKAGGTYVPLDPNHPAERLNFMLSDSRARVLVTQGHLGKQWGEYGGRMVKLDEERAKIEKERESNLGIQVNAENLAYVIYTSGSTGKPKGVGVGHGALTNFLETMKEYPGFGREDVLLAVTTLSFDIAGLELYLPLSSGGGVRLLSGELSRDGVRLGEEIERGITVMQATPATWRMLVETGWKGKEGLKILCGGEALDVELARGLAERGGELWNMYGPTETTIWSLVERVEVGAEKITIGRPIGNTQVYVPTTWNLLS